MNVKKRIKYIITTLFAFVVAIIISGQGFLSAFLQPKYVFASGEIAYSDVLDDLRKSENFDESKYPSVDDDYSVKLITIAESDYNELFLYVYQPSSLKVSFTCRKVSISLGFSKDGKDLNSSIYNLKLVSSNGVFYKYLVENLQFVKEENTHYFNIVALYRNSNSLLEESITGGTTDSVAYAVGEQWCCYVKNGTLCYDKSTFKTVQMTPILNGSLNLKDGSSLLEFLGVKAGRKVLFLAFNVDNFSVSHIYDADLFYEYRYVESSFIDQSPDLSGQYPKNPKRYSEDGVNWDKNDVYYTKKVTLSEKDGYSYKGIGLFSKEYTWKSIYSTAELIKEYKDQDIQFKDGTYELLKESQYVFCYADYGYTSGSSTDVSQGLPTITTTTTWSTYADFKEVTVLRLHFLDAFEGELNLGVVCDITTADKKDDAEGDGKLDLLDKIFETLKKLFSIVLVIILIIILWPFISPVIIALFKLIFKGLGLILKFLFNVVIFPFKLIFGKKKQKKR